MTINLFKLGKNMKKIALASLLVFAAVGAGAQSINDALLFSENDYYGTARTVAMGNAFTALGGDLGSIGINPAGSAVARYGQFTITPNISIMSTGAQFNADPGVADYGTAINNTRSRFTLPNYGVSMYMDLKRRNGLKGFSFGFTGNATSNYLDQVSVFGDNPHTSYLGNMAAGLKGISSSVFGNNPYDNRDVYWDEVIGWRTGMIYNEDGSDVDYLGSTERIFDDGSIGTGGALTQRWGRQTRGYKQDMVMNMGFNISDKLFLGANLGLISIGMDRNLYIAEEAVNPQDFPNNFEGTDTYFSYMRMRNYLEVEGSGVYGKFGFIFVPVPAFRIGAAIQTPTSMHIHEFYHTTGEIAFTDSRYSATENSPQGEGEYRLISPYRVNAGLAWNFGTGVFSADYEMADYSTMQFKSAFDGYAGDFSYENQDIKQAYGKTHAFRFGFEVKPMPDFAIRAGYNVATVADKVHDKDSALRQSASFGLGYSSPGAFFFDLAFRGNFRPNEYYVLYGDNANPYVSGYLNPEVKIGSQMWDIVATLGWRF